MKFAVGGLVLATALLGAAGASQAQTLMWPFSMCREGFTYDAKQDVCIQQKAKKAGAKAAKTSSKKK
jgi:hypothetical protein